MFAVRYKVVIEVMGLFVFVFFFNYTATTENYTV